MVPAPDRAAARAKAVIRHQQAFKLALSMTLFYWLALYMNWELAHYGAFAITIISLGTAKASIARGLMRFFGTTAGVLVGFVLLGLFNHDPWAMLAALSLHMLIIGVVMQASRYPYAWYMAAFVPLTVWADTYPHFENVFSFGTFRWLETTAGVIIFSLVELIFWPQPETESTRDNEDAGTGADQGSAAPAPPALKPLWNSTNLIKSLFPPLAFMVACVVWYLVYLPPGSRVPMLVGILSLVFLRESIAPPWQLFSGFVVVILFVAAPICWMVMPRLSTGAELLTLVFLYTFVAGELGGFVPPLKLLMVYQFVAMAGISNQQVYSFQGPIDGALLFLLAGIIIILVYYLFEPFIPKSEVVTPGNTPGSATPRRPV